MKVTRGPYQGVLQIVRFNWPMYLCATLVIVIGSGVAFFAPLTPLLRTAVLAALLFAVFWLIVSLLVSHYVYDRSALYSGDWLNSVLKQPPARSAIFHVGLDEFSEILRNKFPGSDASIVDFFDPQEMTEPSILRARRENATSLPAANRVDFRALPFREGTFDVAFLIFAAHELRRATSRRQLLEELHRVLGSQGKIVLVEHLRDLANFCAFGPGFLHFHSRAEWLRGARAANFSLAQEFSYTPFVRVYLLEKET